MIKAFAAGRLVNDAKVFSYGKNNTGINFDLACNQFGSDEPVYVRCTQFNRDENTAQYLTQGNQVIVHGNLNIKPSADGKYYTSIIVDDWEFGAKKKSKDEY